MKAGNGQVGGSELKSLKSEEKGRKGSNLMEHLSKALIMMVRMVMRVTIIMTMMMMTIMCLQRK